MSDGEGSVLNFIPGWIRIVVFLVILAISAPFLVIGNYKNGRIKSCVDLSLQKLGQGNLIGAQEKIEEASEHFGLLYDCYVMVLPVVGGTYYDKKTFWGMRGVVRTGGIAHRMSEGNLDVDELMEETDNDLNSRGVFPSSLKPLQTVAQKQLKSLKRLLPIMRENAKGNYEKVFADLGVFLENKENLEYEHVLMPVCYLLTELALNTRDSGTIELSKAITMGMAKKSTIPFFQKMVMKVAAVTPQKAEVASAVKSPPQKKSLKEKFASAMTYARKKQFEKALPLLEECYSAKPQNDKVCYTLALVKRKMGQNSEAKKICEELLSRQPENEKVKKLMASIK